MSEYDEQRVTVLRYYYDLDLRCPGMLEQTATVMHETGLPFSSVSRAQRYLTEKYFLETTAESGPGNNGYSYACRITSRGQDFFEHPDEFKDQGIPQTLIQVVTGHNYGSMVQGGTVNIQPAPLPVAELTAAIQGNTEALSALQELTKETSSPEPRLDRVAKAVETLKSVTEIATTFGTWLSDPQTHQFMHQLAARALGH